MNILVIGGYGNFGKRLSRQLLTNTDHSVTVAGRSKANAARFCQQLESDIGKPVTSIQLNVLNPQLQPVLVQLETDIVINASGPFQDQLGESCYAVARACIGAGCHYIDLCDSREFVSGFSSALKNEAIAAGVMLVTGASTVPGLSTAVIDAYLPEFENITHIEYGASPGNQTERGKGTISSILSCVGKPFTTMRDGKMQRIYGWQGICRTRFSNPIGKRWMSNCDIPDLDLLPARYQDLQTVEFKAGLELTLLHVGLWLLSWLSRAGLVESWSRYAKPLTRMSEWFINMGSNCGGMFVKITGTSIDQRSKTIQWQIIAENGTGPNIPVIAPELIINRIAEGKVVAGAMPCMGLFTLGEFMHVAKRWGIYSTRDLTR